ncbi:hypothetical protein BP6252_08556 [Coleophoma cylindrospora]|uniref:Major facilitator superfamily (MFS) profile domain-containing protein n=1 Tax=Coleophoma cylindrospora TaxID=1849047 RepID=A0A3D8R6B6_9HELO|nr:hypothetical protein BP6252_08556 [Coleophoma cylindrospora]
MAAATAYRSLPEHSGAEAGGSTSPVSSSSNTQFTPESDSDDSDFDADVGSYKMRRAMRDSEKSDHDLEEEYHDGSQRRASVSTTHSYQLYTPDEERAVVRKFDRRLVLFVALLYMLSFLDRSNIGNARIAGLAKDLHLDSSKYEWVLTSFYIAYVLFEWMSILWKLVPAHIYVTMIVLSWGVVASLQSCATSFGGLLVLRFLLGIGEAGFTGIPYYLSFFFKREELALRTGIFIAAAPLATSFASTLAWIILKLGKHSPIASWRLLFLVEGCPSIFIAVLAWRVIPDGPAKATYLTKREKKVARLRLRKQSEMADASGSRSITFREVVQTILDPKSYLTAFMFFCTNMAFSSMPVFLPTIIHEMGHGALMSQALSAPPFLASFVGVIITAWFSDRLQNRSLFICIHASLSAVGYSLMALAGIQGWGIWWRYAAIFPATIGFFSVITIIIAWTINNQESASKQGVGFAILQVIGQLGPFVGTRLYPRSDAPLYTRGMSVCAAAMVVVVILALVLRLYLTRKNKQTEEAYGRVGEEADQLVTRKATNRASEPFKYML